jgi:hypothetical protein
MLLNELLEGGTKHVTFCFGRMNPPTIGHKEVFKTMTAQGGDVKIFVSQTQDKKNNPLDYSTKIKFIKAIHPEFAANVVDDPSLNTIVKVASFLFDQGYNAATFVAGSDRLESMSKLLKDYNGVEGKSHGFYKFDVLDFKSSGDREDGAEGVAGISASGARDAAATNNFEKFKEATGAGKFAKPLFDAVRKGMNINESVESLTELTNDEESYYKYIIAKMKLGRILTTKEKEFVKTYQIYKQSEDLEMSEAPIEMDPGEPMNPMIVGHDKANPAKLKYRMLRAAGQLKDLAARAENASPGEWQLMARQFDELKMNMEQIRHALEELGKVKRKGGIRSRGITV